MIIECCSIAVLEYETKERIRCLEKGESVKFNITSCEVIDDTFDLEITYTISEVH